jgi:hypothetical protein
MNVLMKMVSLTRHHDTGAIRMTTADNVRLWLVGDPYMCHLTKKSLRTNKSKDEAAHALIKTLHGMDLTKTPDGAPLTVSSVRKAITWLDGY